jgi:hypothetical protein
VSHSTSASHASADTSSAQSPSGAHRAAFYGRVACSSSVHSIAKFTALVLFSLTIPLGGSNDTFANAGTKIYFFLEAVVYAAVKAVLLCVSSRRDASAALTQASSSLRTLALYQNHTAVRLSCVLAWFVASGFHFINCWTFSATANPIPGLTSEPVRPIVD